MTVDNFPAKLVFFKFLHLVFEIFVKLELQSSTCVSCILNVYKFSVQNLVEWLSAGAAWISATYKLKSCSLLKIHYNATKISSNKLSSSRSKLSRKKSSRGYSSRINSSRSDSSRGNSTRDKSSRATRAGPEKFLIFLKLLKICNFFR